MHKKKEQIFFQYATSEAISKIVSEHLQYRNKMHINTIVTLLQRNHALTKREVLQMSICAHHINQLTDDKTKMFRLTAVTVTSGCRKISEHPLSQTILLVCSTFDLFILSCKIGRQFCIFTGTQSIQVTIHYLAQTLSLILDS